MGRAWRRMRWATPERGSSETVGTGGAARRDDVPGLTGLRFIAAFTVLLAHSSSMLMGPTKRQNASSFGALGPPVSA